MTATAPEALQEAPEAQDSPTPAALAIAAAVAAAAGIEDRAARAITALSHGAIGPGTLIDFLADLVAGAVWSARVAGAQYGAAEWQATYPNPRPVESAEQKRLQQGIRTIFFEEVEGVDLTDREKRHEFRDSTIQRTMRLADAEAITAARSAYVEEVEVALEKDAEDDDDPLVWVWKYTTDADPCGRCVALSQKTFETSTDAPESGGHVGCQCTLGPEIKNGDQE